MKLTKAENEIINKILDGESELDDFPELYEKLYEYFTNNGEMPYGVAKARDGDPINWISERLYKLHS